MKLVVYKSNSQGFFNRQIKEFDKFPTKEEASKLALTVCHPIDDEKIRLYATGKYNPLHLVENERDYDR